MGEKEEKMVLALLKYLCLLYVLFFNSCMAKEDADHQGDHGEILDRWNSEGEIPSFYAEACLDLLIYNQKCGKGDYLTLGNVISDLGMPTMINYVVPVPNSNSGFDDTQKRLDVWYESKQVMIGFSLGGFVEEVAYRLENGSRHGKFKQDWPLSIENVENLPVLSGKFNDSEVPQSLMNTVNGWLDKMTSVSYWSDTIWGKVPDFSKPVDDEGRITKKQILVIDGISNDLVHIIFKVHGPTIAYFDVWWENYEGGWRPISNMSAVSVLRKN